MSKAEADCIAKYLFVGFDFIFVGAWLVIQKWPWYQDSYLSHYINNYELVFIILATIILVYIVSLIEYLRFKYVNCYTKALINTIWSYFHPIIYYGLFLFVVAFLVLLNNKIIPNNYQIYMINFISLITIVSIAFSLIKMIYKLVLSIFATRKYFYQHNRISIKH
jgi:uncharacterized Tic20 family protein